jgi:hypothetical protein
VDSAFEKQMLFRSLKRVSGAKRRIDDVNVIVPKEPRIRTRARTISRNGRIEYRFVDVIHKV